MKVINRLCLVAVASIALLGFSVAQAADYDIDTKGMHAYIEFKVPHLGYSILSGRFNDFSGSFSWDRENPEASKIMVTIQTASLDSNHEKRDKHLISPDFLNVDVHPTAVFNSSSYDGDASGGTLKGDITLNGVTKPIELQVSAVGEGKDPWGGYRAGFTAHTRLNSADFGYTGRMFPKQIDMALGVEGVRKK